MSSLSSRVVVRVDLQAGGDLAQKMRENEQQAQRLQAATARQSAAPVLSQAARQGPAQATLTPQSLAAPPASARQQAATITPPATGPASVQDRLAARLAMRGQRAEFVGGQGAALFQEVALAEERARGEQRVAQARAILINLAQPEEAAQQRLEMSLGARVQLQQQLLQLQSRAAVGRSGIFDEIAGLNAIQSAEQTAIASRGQLAAFQSPRGRAAIMDQIALTKTLAREQQKIELQARFGRTGGAVAAAGLQALPVVGAVAAAGGAVVAAGLSGLPTVSEQLSTSFRMLTNEIGISLIPAIVSASHIAQEAAALPRAYNDLLQVGNRATGLQIQRLTPIIVVSDLISHFTGNRPQNVINTEGQRGELGAGYEAGQLALYQGSAATREQEARALRETMSELNGTIRDRIPPREGL